MKKMMAALTLVTAAAGAFAAPQISNATAIPDEFVLLNFNGSGLDWVYAGPIAPQEWSSDNLAPASYRASEGWRVATASEWAARPEWDDFIAPGNPCGFNSGTYFTSNHSCYIYATPYWSSMFDHVDIGDYRNGFVTDGFNNFQQHSVYETIYVRNSGYESNPNPVPVPGTLPLVGLAFACAGFVRRKSGLNSKK